MSDFVPTNMNNQGIMTDIAAVQQVADVFHRSDRFDIIKAMAKELEKDITPRNVMGYDMLCYLYYKAKDYKNAIRYGELAVGSAATPQEKAATKYNIGKCYLNGNEPIKARNSFDIVSKMHPERADIKLDLAASYYACNQKDEAYKSLKAMEEEMWRYDDRNALAIQFNLGAHLIRHGDFKTGMEFLTIGRKLRIWGSYTHNFPIPEWDGKTYPGANILFVGEGGIGDEIINARFVRHINERGMKASFASCQNLASILSRMPFEKVQNYQKFTTDIKDIAEYDFWTPVMNLPKTCGVDFDELWDEPYLTVDNDYDSKWKEILPDTGKLKVGVRWSGNPLYEHDLHRSVPLDMLWDNIKDRGWDVYSIQRDYDLDRLKQYPDITPLHDKLETFEDALGCINNLDLVITSCTSVGHAAAALGKKVIVFTPIMDYYIWAEGRKDCSWYGDNLRLCRQTIPKRWNEAFDQLNEMLEDLEVN